MLYVLTLSQANNDHLEIVPTNWFHLEMTKTLTKYHIEEPAGWLASSSNISDPRLYSVKQQELALK